MARIAGVDLPSGKRVEVGIRYIYGIGASNGLAILRQARVDPNKRVRDLTEEEVARVRGIIDRDVRVEGDLRREISQNTKRLIDIACYRGVRHRRGLPARGQRTRTNARTKKGARRTVAGKRRAIAKK
ncbi:MAG: 30S ribosomal protein S13 [Chloroflexi bacterium]|nr:30S ribosomal protein S13 [Chloroflexota bacterium]